MATQPFYGDPAAQARVWSKYAVLLGDVAADIPATNSAFTLNDPTATVPVVDQWDPTGALSSDTPFDDGAETITSSDHTAAGFGVYATTHKDQKEIITFNAKQTTLITLGLLYDASALTETSGVVSGTLALRDPTKLYLAGFQRENAVDMERRISKNFAQIDSITRAFSNDESVFTVALAIIPNADRELYLYYLGPKA